MYNNITLEKNGKGGVIMLKNKSKGILIILLFLFTTLFSNTKLVFADNDNYKLEINYGIDGSYKSGKYVPFEVKVTAAEDFVGEVEIKVKSNIADMYDSYSKELSIEAGKSSTVLIPVNFINGNEACQIDLVDSNGKVLTTKNVNITNGRINEYSIAVGILTEDKSALSYLSSITINNQKNSGYVSLIESLPITTDYLGDLGLSIDGLDAIIINNFNVANLSETNYNALENWIEKGGTLIIGSGANEAKTIKSIDSKFLNVKTSGTKEEMVNLLGDTLNLVSSNITLENSNPIILGQEDSLAYSVSKGNGEVIVTTFDLGLEPFISSNVTEEVIITLLNTPYEKIDSNIQGGYRGYSYTNLTNSLPIGKIANFKLIVTIIAVYAVLVGFVAYIVLKAMNKRDLTWIVIPALSLIFTIVIYFFGANTRFKDIILNQINIVNIKEDGVGNLKGYIGISSENKDEIIVQNNNNAFNAIKENYYYNVENSGYKNLVLKTLYKEDTAQYKIGKGGSLTTTSFEALGGEIVVDKITYDLKMKGNSIDGTITNNFDYDIEKLLVVSNKIIWDFGYVKAKETKTVENVNIVSNNGLQNYAQIALSDKYYNDRYNSSKNMLSDEYKNILRNYNLLSTISNEESFNKEKIVAITSVPFDYRLKFNDKSVSKFDTTVIIQDIELNFKDESGVYNYPEGYFSGEYTYNSKEVYFNEYQNELYGTGEAIINYNLAKDINFEEVGLRIKRNYDYLPSTQAIEIYNRESESYESMLITEDKSVINNLDKYLDKNNVITIKIQVDDYKGQIIIPVISAMGRAK